MSFDDLPDDWPQRPLNDPELARDVLDLFVRDADRREGGVSVLICHADHTLAQPLFVNGSIPRDEAAPLLRNLFAACAQGGPGGAVVVALVRESGGPCDDDRALHQMVIDGCAELGLGLLSTHLVTCPGILTLPSPLPAS